MSKYYYLISSLPELFFDAGGSKNLDFLHIRDYMLENLSTADIGYVYNSLNHIDNHNLITAIYRKSRAWKKGGQMEFQSVDELSKLVVPDYMLHFLEYMDDYKAEHKSNPDELVAEKYLSELYYNKMENSDNRFIANWFKFDRETRNIQSAYLCRRLGASMEDYLVNKDDITELLLKNTSPDFGLSRERDYMPELLQTLEIQNLFDRESKLDILRWKQIDEINVMEYFSVDVALGILQKAYIADRWLSLDNEKGRKLFRKLIDDLIKEL
jgi:hypothetical protein